MQKVLDNILLVDQKQS